MLLNFGDVTRTGVSAWKKPLYPEFKNSLNIFLGYFSAFYYSVSLSVFLGLTCIILLVLGGGLKKGLIKNFKRKPVFNPIFWLMF